jgi:NADH-quinone oxidoreductase subunit M
VGIVVGVAYTWRALQKAFFSDVPHTHHMHGVQNGHAFAPITWPEVTGFGLLAATSLAIGLYPRILLDTIEPAVKALLAGGGQ